MTEIQLIGQEEVKLLLTAMSVTKSNVLLVGEPGIGKTAFAHWYLNKFTSNRLNIIGQKELPGNMNAYKTVFIDEAHKLMEPEDLYPYLDPKGYYDSFLNKYVKNPIFALATTDQGTLPKALLSRLVLISFRSYTFDEIVQIIQQHHSILNKTIAEDLAVYSYNNPRRAIKLGSFIINAIKSGMKPMSVNECLKMLGYDEGLNSQERSFLTTLIEKPYSITTLSGVLGIGRVTVNEIESGLISAKLVEITNKGRQLTQHGMQLVQKLLR